MNATNNARRITWNLATEFETAGAPNLPGVEFSMNVERGQTPTGDEYYRFTLPRLQAGNSNIQIALLEIKINGQVETSATTFKGINLIVPSNQTRDLTLTNMIVPTNPAGSDTLSVGFGVIEETTAAPVAPGAVRFASLVQPGGIFANNCLGCHSGNNPSANLDLSNYNQARGNVTPNNPNNSLIFQRMNDNNNPMPPSGRLNGGQISIVEDWINSGAPQ